MFTDQPYILTEIPYMFTDQPYIVTEIPYMFTDQPYILTEIGVLPSIDSHSKHNIVHGKLNFKFLSPPPYKRKVWNYRAAKVDLVRDQLDNVNWDDLFHNLNVNEMCLLFTDVFLGVMSTNISNKTITCNDKDAPWITTSRNTAIKRNSRVYRKWIQRGRNPTEHQNVRYVQKSTNKLIKQAKQTYFTSLGKKTFRSQYRTKELLDRVQKNLKKNDVFISNFLQKADILNYFFASQCTIEDNGSTLPAPTFKTDDSLSYFEININQIINIINKFSPNKSHGHDGISQVAIPLQIIFQSCISFGSFPDIWKYANVQPVHKKVIVN